MSRNPFINALCAAGYISLFVTAVFTMPKYITDNELGMMSPILFLSLFVISAATMGYLFVYPSARLLIERKQAEATRLYLMTLFSFVCITGAMILSWLIMSTSL